MHAGKNTSFNSLCVIHNFLALYHLTESMHHQIKIACNSCACVRYVVRYIRKGKLPTCITLILGIWLNYFQYISRPQLLAGTTRMVKRSVFFCPLTKVGLLQWGRRQWWPTRQPILNARDLRELARVEAETIDFCMKSDTDVTRDMFDIDELISSHLNLFLSIK